MLSFKALKITDKVYWVGAIDWDIRDFHGYKTGRGTTYNAYLILADKITLIDTVKRCVRDEMMARISSIIDPSKINYIVSNHAEMDHSGSLPEVIDIVKPEKVFASTAGVKALMDHFHWDVDVVAVKDGDTLSLGNASLQFFETRMIHWPDSMFSYLKEDELLFSQDGFGMHLASSERFADQIPEWLLDHEAGKYFANILLPLSDLIGKLVEKVASSGLSFKIIAPDHGPIWRKDPSWIIGRYVKWAEQKPNKKAVLIYDSMWGSTALMARAIAEGIEDAGATPVMLPLSATHRSDVATHILDCGAILVGSPTINNNMFPTVADVMTYLRGLKPKNLIGVAFGSYGWSGEAVWQVEEILKSMKIDLVADSIKSKYIPDGEILTRCFDAGKLVGSKLSELL
jgi:flavorubredoxin